MKILLFGKNGQVGFELQRSLAPLGEVIALDRSTLDLNDLIQLEAMIKNIAPDMIVNAAAYTQVDNAENDEKNAMRLNAQVPEIMAKTAKEIGAWFIHYSTDYVFDGDKTTPYEEEDLINPINVYGRTKAAGENAIKASGCRYLILRTSWVYAARGKNFLRTMLRLASSEKPLRIVNDQIGAPTSADLIADITALIVSYIKNNPYFLGGIYHLCAAGETSWHGFASYILKTASITGIPSIEYPTPAKRPMNSRLNTLKLCQQFNVQLPHWQQHVDRVISVIKEAQA
jgi:dTDP-4-dehydrorhamnose reductase